MSHCNMEPCGKWLEDAEAEEEAQGRWHLGLTASPSQWCCGLAAVL